jgi:antirestriction protein ArdC
MTTSHATTDRRDIHADITNSIIAAIEAGPGHFELPWHRSGGAFGRPRNAATKQRYNGVNIVVLWASAELHGFTSPVWATYRQWQSIGAQVRRGERASPVVFYKRTEFQAEDDQGEPTTKTRLFARSSRVFNADQVDGFQPENLAPVLPDQTERLQQAEAFIAATRADIRYGGDRAFYSPAGDFISIPARERFTGTATSTATEAFYSTVLHELTHWSGAAPRCNRDLTGRFGDNAYAMEELVADLGAAFLCSDLGITSTPRADHAAYLASWLKVLKDDTKAIFTAASKASEAAEFLTRLAAPADRAAA